MNARLLLLALLYLAAPVRAADPEWKPVATKLLLSEKTGFGGLCGVVVDPKSGEIYVNLSDRGMFNSADAGNSWNRCGETQPKGRTETPGCWLIDPTGTSKNQVVALVYGSPISVSKDSAAKWTSMHLKSGHVDWCAVDWTDADHKFMLALKHEANGLLLLSNDGGKNFTEVGKGYGTGWIFDNKTAVVAEAKGKDKPKPNLMRTTDGGKNFKSCGEYNPVGGNGSAQALPKWLDGTLYWLVDGGLITTVDKGETWKKIGEVKDAQYGPIFGKTAKQMFVLTKNGIVESSNGGESWSKPIAAPSAMKGLGGLSWLAYDAIGNNLYLMKMGSDLYKLHLAK